MGINFPNAPSTGQLYPQPAVVGLPVYRWDGEKWTTQGASATRTPIYADGSVPMTAQLKLFGSPPVAANDAAPKNYVDALPPPAGSLRYDQVQALTDAQTAQSRANIYAAPFDADAYNGLQINGSTDIDQANSGASQPVAGATYVCDQWIVGRAGTWTASTQQVADAPPGYNNSLKVAVTAGNVSPAPSDILAVRHMIEGVRVARCRFGTANAQPVSIGFWVKAHRPGQYSGALQNGAAQDRSYTFPFTINAADTWEYKTATIPGDITGTWVGWSTQLAWYVWFLIAGGSARYTTGNVWTGGNFHAATGSINGAQAATDTFQVTGLIVLPGIELPSALRSPFTQRAFDDELRACQRYYWQLSPGVTSVHVLSGAMANATIGRYPILFPQKMRAQPTMLMLPDATHFVNNPFIAGGAAQAGTSVSFGPHNDGAEVTLTSLTTGVGAGPALMRTNSSVGKIIADARL